MRNVNHVISRRILDFASQIGCPTIALEDLGGVFATGASFEKSKAGSL